MKSHSKTSAKEPDPVQNQVGLLAWSLLAHPHLININMVASGIPGQPDPDSPGEQPNEPGSPVVPDQPPPAPVA
jgi:hypothetical protein